LRSESYIRHVKYSEIITNDILQPLLDYVLSSGTLIKELTDICHDSKSVISIYYLSVTVEYILTIKKIEYYTGQTETITELEIRSVDNE